MREGGSVPLERLERRFWREIWRVAPLDSVFESGVEIHWFGPVVATAFADMPEAPGLNMIHGAAEPGAASDGHLAEAVEWMDEMDVDFFLHVAMDRPGTEQAEAWLNWHGYEQSGVMRKYARPARPPAWEDPPNVEVLELQPNETECLSHLVPEGFGLPESSCFLFCGLPEIPSCRSYSVLLEGYEVACGSMLIADGVALLALDATATWARRRGCHRALLRRRLIDAAEAGCHTVFAVAPDEPGKAVSAASASLQSAGFLEAYRSVTWRPPWREREGLGRFLLRDD